MRKQQEQLQRALKRIGAVAMRFREQYTRSYDYEQEEEEEEYYQAAIASSTDEIRDIGPRNALPWLPIGRYIKPVGVDWREG